MMAEPRGPHAGLSPKVKLVLSWREMASPDLQLRRGWKGLPRERVGCLGFFFSVRFGICFVFNERSPGTRVRLMLHR